jgi:hypothetical protein
LFGHFENTKSLHSNGTIDLDNKFVVQRICCATPML